MGRLIDTSDLVKSLFDYENGKKTLGQCIDDTPTAQQWIPCKTRLPEDLEEVNVTWVNHKPESYYEFAKDKPFTASAVYYKGDWYWYSSTCADILGEYGKNDIEKVDDAIEITAWKPLEDPWEGEP